MKYVVVQFSDGFIQCRGIYNELNTAVGEAFLCASESAEHSIPKAEKISPLYDLEDDTGVGIDVEFENYTQNYFVLFVEDDTDTIK